MTMSEDIKIKVYGLSGKSGTGKSFQALNLCRRRGIVALIDDGLFIYKNKIEAGHSAKRDSNKITAIRTAIFEEPEDREAVSARIREMQPESLLIIGTSDNMVKKIASRLELPEIIEIIHIEDISDSESISTALHQRREMGRHVIPVPTVEIQPQFSGYFMAPFRALFSRNGKIDEEDEKSIVRPTYSYLGKYSISNSAVRDIMEFAGEGCRGVAEILKCSAEVGNDGVELNVTAAFEMNAELRENIEGLQETISSEVFRITSFNILAVNVVVRLRRV